MSKAIKVIRSEHAGLVAIYRTLGAIVQEIEEGKSKADFELFHAMLEYLKSFMYRFHHPKESEYLFPAIARRDPQAAELVARLEAQHRQGAALLKELDQALGRYESEGDAALPLFKDTFERYHDFEWRHMSMEENEIIPLAREVLTQEDWAGIDKVFSDHDDPLFGDERRAEYDRLMQYIAATATAPIGLHDKKE